MPRKNKYITNRDIAKAIAKKYKIAKGEADKIIELYFEEIKKNLLAGNQVRLSGFGTFEVTKWNSKSIYDVNNRRKVEREMKTVLFKDSVNLQKKVLE